MKIGIITMYHNSVNYGGNLQAYALVKVIEKIKSADDCVEQISYVYGQEKKKSFIQKIKDYARKILIVAANQMIPVRRKRSKSRKIRKKAMERFRMKIPHSEKIYNPQNINQSVAEYDIFITGSDQVWNPIMYENAFRLDFVPKEKTKISYAASISQNALTQDQRDVFKNTLEDYHAVSVREKNTVDLIADVSPVEVEWVLDPTMLLSADEWDVICDNPVEQNGYVFCYFLSNNEVFEKRAKEFARVKNLKLVSIAYLSSNRKFADMEYCDVSPAEFIAFIKSAEYVLTDSFHASVFSLIYKKQFFVFERVKYKEMLTRLTSLLSMFDAEDRICFDVESNETWWEQKTFLNYEKTFPKYETMRDTSMNFLKDALDKN